MGQFVGCIQGMAEACCALAFPVVSGNVSLYNETNGAAIPPTPGIGAIGLVHDLDRHAVIALQPGRTILLIGEQTGHLGQSLYQKAATGKFEGAPPPVDLEAEKRTGDFVRALIREGLCDTVHDVSDGGLLVALAEMALAGGTGFTVAPGESEIPLHAYFFGEDQARYLLAVSPEHSNIIANQATEAGLAIRAVAESGGGEITLPNEKSITLAELRTVHEDWFPRYFGEKEA